MRSRAAAALLAIVGLATVSCRRADVYAVTAATAIDGSSDATGTGVDVAGAQAIYVAPDGDDSNPGTFAQPLRTVAKARDLVRTKNSAMTADITVYLRGGTYPQTGTLTFTNADSGSGGFYVRYMSYQNERPLITGGQPIKGWKLSEPSSNIYSASAGPTPFRQLYVNGVKAIRARSPNLGTDGAANFNRLSGYDNAAHDVQVLSSYVSDWKNLTKVEMHLMTAWADNTLRIASVSTAGNTASIKFQSDEDAMLFVRPSPTLDTFNAGPARVFYFENAYEMLDQPGEWYLDETANVVYYKPRNGEDMATATVVAPMVETILSVKGTSTSDQVSHLWFQGLTFAHSTYMRPSQYGFLDYQSGQYNLTAPSNNKQTVGRPNAGVSVMNANHIQFERNMFTQMAATGLDFASGTHDDKIIGNVFTEIGGNGMSVGKFTVDETTEFHVPYNPADKNEICTNETIKNNYVHNVTTEFQGASGIAGGYPRNIDIEHNEVEGANFTAIILGYGLTTSANAMASNKINYNNIHHVLAVLGGGAAIIAISNQSPASEMQYNYFHDFAMSQWADFSTESIFLNDGTVGYNVAHNVMDSPQAFLLSPNAGANTSDDNGPNPNGAQNTMAVAGIEPSYSDIKNLTIPVATF
jgi:hypothetical protein